MMSNLEKPLARPLFRRLATLLAIFCFILAGLFGGFLEDGKWFFVAICLFDGFVMTAIATTGSWPPKR